MKKVALIAPASCDKTTTAREIVKILKKEYKLNFEVVHEYARKYIEDNYIESLGKVAIYDPHQQLIIAHGQIELEEKLGKIYSGLVCDAASFLAYVYAKHQINKLNKEVRARPMYNELLYRIRSLVVPHAETYDLIFLLPITGEVYKDGVRVQGVEDQRELYELMLEFLSDEKIPYIPVEPGLIEEKAEAIVNSIIDRLDRSE